MKTYSAFYTHNPGQKVFTQLKGSELFGKVPVASRLVSMKIKDLEQAGEVYQTFITREGTTLVVMEDKVL